MSMHTHKGLFSQYDNGLQLALHTKFVVLVNAPNLFVCARSQNFNQAAFICSCTLGNCKDKIQDHNDNCFDVQLGFFF